MSEQHSFRRIQKDKTAGNADKPAREQRLIEMRSPPARTVSILRLHQSQPYQLALTNMIRESSFRVIKTREHYDY